MNAMLQVSVVEAANIVSDASDAATFVVQLKLGPNVVVTDEKPMLPGSSPKFMKNAKFAIESNSDSLAVELIQKSTKGDLVLGTCDIPVADLKGKPTFSSWVELLDAGGERAADVFLVLRYSSGLTPPSSPQRKAASTSNEVPAKKEATRQLPSRKKGEAGSPSPRMQGGIGSGLMLLAASVAVSTMALLARNRPLYYEVQEGDTLCSIGECYGRSYKELQSSNERIIPNPDLIYPGDRIRIK